MADELFDAKSADGSFNLVNPSPCPLKAEGASSFNQLLQDHGISQELTDRLLADGWDAKSFRHVVCQESELAGVLPEMFPDTEVSLMQRAKLRAVWSSLQRRGSNEPAPAEPLGSPAKQGSGWSEAFAPKLDATRVATLKKRFLEAFPSEILTAMNTPSLRLLSTAVDAEVKKNWSWIPWKSRMTQQMYEDSLMQKPAKRARIETLQLSDLLLDEPPQIDINDSTMGISMIRRLLEVHDNALALAGTAHLARLKAYTSKFLSLVSQKFPPETNLRPPSVLEAQQADKHLWSCIFQLVIEKEWQVNDAIYEFTEIRGDMSSWLQPRAKAASAGNRRPYTPGGRDNRPPTPPPGRGTGKGKGKAKSPTKQGTQPRGVPWVREYKEGGQVKKLCIGWQIGKCQRGNSCEFTHGCVAGSIHSWGELPAPPPLPPPIPPSQQQAPRGSQVLDFSFPPLPPQPLSADCTVSVSPPQEAVPSVHHTGSMPSGDVAPSTCTSSTPIAPIPPASGTAPLGHALEFSNFCGPALAGLFDCILCSLREAPWPQQVRRAHIISGASSASGYFNFGVQLSRRSSLTQVTIALPELCRDLNALFRFLFPNEHWNALCVSRNGLSALHSDSANIPGSRNLSLSLGAFSGGHLWIEDLSCLSQGQPTSVASGSGWLHGCAIDTHRKAISFDGRIRHMTLPFSGERWALTAFSLPDVCCAELEFLGFPLPSPLLGSSPAPSPSASPTSPAGLEEADITSSHLLAGTHIQEEFPSSGNPGSASEASADVPPAQHLPSAQPMPGVPEAVSTTKQHEPQSCREHTVHSNSASSKLPLGCKLWGKRSTSGLFLSHKLKVARPLSPPEGAWRADTCISSLPARLFLEITWKNHSRHQLSMAVRASGGNSLTLSPSLDPTLDVLCPDLLEQVLFLCGSGAVAYLAASPLAESADSPDDVGSSSWLLSAMHEQTAAAKVSRCTWLLSIVHTAGGQGHLELPPTSSYWSSERPQAWLHQGNCALILIPPLLYSDSAIPCQPQLLAASYRPLSALAVSSPAFAPPQCASAFASSFATIAAPLLPAEGRELSLQSVIKSIPRKGLFAGPHALHDGAGKRSIADWSSPASHDALRGLRKALLQFCISARADKRLLARGSCPSNEPLFSSSEVSAARDLVFPSLGMQTPDNAWYVHPYQPMCLHAFEALAQHCGDQDIHLFPHLRMGVPTGYLNDIPPSNCFWPPKGQSGELIPLALNLENWKSADVAPEVTSRLLQEELDAGYCFKFEGTLEEAKSRWPVGLALGKLGVVRAPGRAERLVLDNSVAGTNSQCTVPERQCFPSIHDVSHSFPIRETSDRQMAICIDVKQAHKRCRIRDSEQGLLGFTWHNALYFFRCCPFGAVFSQHWWGRVGGCTLRLLHTLLFLAHVGLLFVDDFIFSQAASLMPLSGAVICLFLQILGVPVSWKKLQISCRVDWIGWRLCFSSGTVSLREEKRLRLLEQVRSLVRGGGRISTKELESFLGLAMWACALFPTMRAMMHPFYKDLWSPAATNFSIAPESWHSICNFLDSSLRFTASPPHTAIPAGAKLLSARHVPFTTLADLSKVAVTHKRLWLRVECLSSSRRKLSCASIRSLQAFERWLQHVAPLASMRPSQVADVEAFADASASGPSCSLGGFVSCPVLGQVWFTETFSVQEFEAAGIPFGNDLAKEIASCEALAQAGLILALSRLAPCSRVPLRLPSLCDNSGAEAGLNKMFSTKFPLGLVLEHIALLAAMHRISIDVSHVPGAKNCKADALSRPAEYPTPPDCLPCQRIRFGLSALWEPCPEVQIFPSSFTLPWLR
ncbi:unnamed protein product [Symbiodinium sp. CCMP2592]|nr:unnamed protein product [Symbiodinium sp. CCMP2592]